MKELIICRCGLIYGERPETYSPSNPHPANFCPQCDRAVTMADCSVELVMEDDWILTPKHHFHPNYLNY
jgi:hypothetical protein